MYCIPIHILVEAISKQANSSTTAILQILHVRNLEKPKPIIFRVRLLEV